MLALACSVHDPHGGLLWLVEKHIATLNNLFDSMVVVATKESAVAINKHLSQHGISVIKRRDKVIGHTYFEGVKQGWATGADRIFYCDLDRVLHWIEYRPAELKRLIAALRRPSKVDYLILGRTPRAYRSHHEALFATEQLANAVITRALGETITRDYLVGAFVLSRRAVEWILHDGLTPDLGFYSLWPLLTKWHKGRIEYQQCEGLEWETPDRYRDEVKKAGGVLAWRKLHSTPQEWAYRTDIVRQTIRPITS